MGHAEKRSLCWKAFAFPLFVAAVIVLGILLWKPIAEIFRNPEKARAWIDAKGAMAPLAFVGLQILQVVVFIIPGEIIQIGGGYVLGFWGATILSSAGILIGSVINFYVGRAFGRPFVERLVGPASIARIEKSVASGREAAGFFLLFAIPGIPKDALCYVAGMSRISLFLFMAVSGLGRLPGILGSAYMGSSAYKKEYGSFLAVLAVASCLFFAGLVFKDQISDAIHKFLRRRGGDSGDSPDDPAS